MTTVSEVEIQRAYRRLLDGRAAPGPEIYLPSVGTEAARAAWEQEVAEPWWAALRELAGRDRIEIECFVAGDPMYATMGIEFACAAARLPGSFMRLPRAQLMPKTSP